MMKEMLRTVALLVLLLAPLGCPTDPLEYDLSCAADSDCRLVVSCCDGCFAINVAQALESCDSDCVDDACQTRFGAGVEALEAHCSEGRCVARLAQ
jgi:hypothetical protein